jgi:hypothetical protein
MGDGRDTVIIPTAQTGAKRSGGIIITFITAVAVFAGGRAVVARLSQPPTSGAGAAAALTAEAATPPSPTSPAAMAPAPSGASPTPTPPTPPPSAAAAPEVAPPAAGAPPAAPTDPAKPAAAPTGTATLGEDRRAAERDRTTEKDIAREAWRKNLPDIVADDTRATILIPIKGSIEGATYHIGTKPKSVIINLPKAESMITMRFYGIKHDGFRTLWIKKDDNEGTTLRLMLGDAYGPQVEIRDEYIRITVRKPNAPG